MTKRDALDRAYLSYRQRMPTEHRFHTGARFVPGSGGLDSRIAFVGEAPGRQEDEQGVPFVGAAGAELDRLLAIHGVSRANVYVTNVVKFRPPNNSTPKLWEVAHGRWLLKLELSVVDPEFVVLMGATALTAVFPGRQLINCVGEAQRSHTLREYLPVWHPAACLRDPERRAENEKYFRSIPWHPI